MLEIVLMELLIKKKLKEKEIRDGFVLKYYDVEDIDKILEQDKGLNSRMKYFNQELKMIIDYYKKIRSFNEIKSGKVNKRILEIK